MSSSLVSVRLVYTLTYNLRNYKNNENDTNLCIIFLGGSLRWGSYLSFKNIPPFHIPFFRFRGSSYSIKNNEKGTWLPRHLKVHKNPLYAPYWWLSKQKRVLPSHYNFLLHYKVNVSIPDTKSDIFFPGICPMFFLIYNLVTKFSGWERF